MQTCKQICCFEKGTAYYSTHLRRLFFSLSIKPPDKKSNCDKKDMFSHKKEPLPGWAEVKALIIDDFPDIKCLYTSLLTIEIA